jgi:hypothetical protein
MQSVQPPPFFKIFSLAMDTRQFRPSFPQSRDCAPLSIRNSGGEAGQSEAARMGLPPMRPRHGDGGTAG